MADLAITTFCCHQSTVLNESLSFLVNFNSQSYNTVCLASSSIGMVGAIYQILPRVTLTLNHRWYSPSATRGRHIIIWLAVADLLASFGLFTRSFVFKFNQVESETSLVSNTILCVLSSAWIQYFYMATWLWVLFYAIDMKLVLREEVGHPVLYHSVVWTLPAIFTAIGLSILYQSNADYLCVTSSKVLVAFLPNYLATYFPLIVIMVFIPILYLSLSHDVTVSITRSFAQFTNKERQLIDVIKIKFLLINIAFYICWLPNLINGLLIWNFWFTVPGEVILMLWYLMALTNPLQAVFNSIVYRRWTGVSEKIFIPCRKNNASTYQLYVPNNSTKALESGESTPLLTTSINSNCNNSNM